MLSGELNNIIKTRVHQKRSQFQNYHIPYVTPEIRAEINLEDQLLPKAIQSNLKPDWVAFKTQQSKTYKLIKAAKTKYIETKFNHPTQEWNFATKYSGLPSQTTPTLIKHNGNPITSPKKIVAIEDRHYIQKVKNLTTSFTHISLNPLNF